VHVLLQRGHAADLPADGQVAAPALGRQRDRRAPVGQAELPPPPLPVHGRRVASNKKWVETFTERYKREIDVPFALITEAVVLNKEDTVRCLKEAGLVNVQVGVQTLNEDSKKKIDRPESRQQLENAFSLMNKYGIHYQVDHMLGIPGETDEDQRMGLE